MVNLSFIQIGFVWGLVICILLLGALVTLGVLVILKKRKPVNIDVVSHNNINEESLIILTGGRNYTVGASNKVKAGTYVVQVESDFALSVNGVSQDIVNGSEIAFNDGDNVKFEGSNNKLILKQKA